MFAGNLYRRGNSNRTLVKVEDTMAVDFSDCSKLPRRLRKICERDPSIPAATVEKYHAAWERRQNRRSVKGPKPVALRPATSRELAAIQPKERKPPRHRAVGTDRFPCLARGDVIRQDVSNLCGSRGQSTNIYSCAKFGECSLGTYCKRQKIRTCTLCVFDGEHVPPTVLPIVEVQ